jgi:hypothetical protein
MIYPTLPLIHTRSPLSRGKGASLWLAAAAVLSAGLAAAQPYPSRVVRIQTTEAGGFPDAVARLIAQGLSAGLGQQVIVENRAIAAVDVVAKAPADGYTLLFYTSVLWLAPYLRDGVTWDALRDFAPVLLATNSPNIVVVHPTLPVKSVPELIALARAKPGQINYASAGIGSTSHFAGELMKKLAKIDMLHVAYKGSAALLAVVGGETPILFTGPLSVLPHAKAGRLRALAVSTAKRSTAFPDLPTVAEGGAPGYEYTSWYGLLAPRHTPATIVGSLSAAVAQALRTKEVSSFLTGEGFELDGNGPAAFRDFLSAEVAKYIDLTPTIAGLHID